MVMKVLTGKTGVVPKGHGQDHNHKAHDERIHTRPGRRIRVVAQREHHHRQDGRADKLGEEGRGRVHPAVARVRQERRRGAAVGEVVRLGVGEDARAEQAEADERGKERAQDLGEGVAGDLAQREAAVDPEHDGHGRVEVGTGNATRNVDADHAGEAPGPVRRGAVAGGALGAEDDEVGAEAEGELAGDLFYVEIVPCQLGCGKHME